MPIVGAPAFAGLHDSVWIAVLALVTGLFALGLYYYGLQRTPALLASLGELAFPVTTTLVGIYVFDSSLRWTQWLGVALTVDGDQPAAGEATRPGHAPGRRARARYLTLNSPPNGDPVPVVVALELRLVEREVVGRARLDRDPGQQERVVLDVQARRGLRMIPARVGFLPAFFSAATNVCATDIP